MKKSRQVFMGILAIAVIACVGAMAGIIAGAIAGINISAWLVGITLILISVKAIIQFVTDKLEKTKFSCVFGQIVDGTSILLLGGVIGTMNIIDWWIFAIILGVCVVLAAAFVFGLTGKDEGKNQK